MYSWNSSEDDDYSINEDLEKNNKTVTIDTIF